MNKKTSNEKKGQNRAGQNEEEAKGGDSGETGTTGSSGAGGWIPSYYDLLGLTGEEKELIGLAEQALFAQRISVKSQGIEVTALSKMQKLRNKLMDPDAKLDESGGTDLETHPELEEMDGILPDNIVLPESEAAERASNDPKLQNKLRNRLAAKFGMGSSLSMQSMKAEYEKKMKMRSSPAPQEENKPRYRPAAAPKYTPR